ncbi:hypothetical protein H206_06954 [Candidatus Electrothrix aarhusensis]|uniref:Uncharacterized protein n=1 Tax=Candidatus Electrothrix aarhusensis TaxID=1859131 RepID=A0A444J3F8_9BACT|nr:hypothetical protein H206_06954 [Candidatus Electrothrix aarhusensis]
MRRACDLCTEQSEINNITIKYGTLFNIVHVSSIEFMTLYIGGFFKRYKGNHSTGKYLMLYLVTYR